jgi:glycosyltransferase involved in cell wall biosynthesis
VKTSFECIVIVDDSKDTTIPFIEAYNKSDPRFRVILNDLGPGPAKAIKKGISNSKGDFIAVVSGDGSDDVNQIDELVRLVERGVSVAVASRHVQGGQLVGSPFLKGFLSKMAGLSLYHLARIGTRDSTNNFKIYDKNFLKMVTIESEYGFELGLELVTKAKHLKLKIAEVFHFEPLAAQHFLLNASNITNFLATNFNYESYVNSTVFYVLPVFEDVLRRGMLETAFRVRRSNYSYEIMGRKLRIYPIPTTDLQTGRLYIKVVKPQKP